MWRRIYKCIIDSCKCLLVSKETYYCQKRPISVKRVHIYVRTYAHTYMHAYIRTYVRIYIHTYIRIDLLLFSSWQERRDTQALRRNTNEEMDGIMKQLKDITYDSGMSVYDDDQQTGTVQ